MNYMALGVKTKIKMITSLRHYLYSSIKLFEIRRMRPDKNPSSWMCFLNKYLTFRFLLLEFWWKQKIFTKWEQKRMWINSVTFFDARNDPPLDDKTNQISPFSQTGNWVPQWLLAGHLVGMRFPVGESNLYQPTAKWLSHTGDRPEPFLHSW
jgi:hypothetical protein